MADVNTEHRPDTSIEQASEVFSLLGGRLAFLTKVVKKQDIVQAARDMLVALAKLWSPAD